MDKVVVLYDKDTSLKMYGVFEKEVAMSKLNLELVGVNLDRFKKDLLVNKTNAKGNTLKQLVANEAARPMFDQLLQKCSENYNTKTFIILSSSANAMISGHLTLDLTRGSRYRYKGFNFFVIDSVQKLFTTNEGKWVLGQDLRKVCRLLNNKPRKFPKFTYSVARTTDDCQKFANQLQTALFTACDIETSGKPSMISCISYTGFFSDGSWHTFVIPLINPTKPNNAHWDNEDDEVIAWLAIRKINANPNTRFIFHNGQYDGSYLVRYCCPTSNYLWDTMHMWHSLFCELAKSLKYVTSFANDHYRYWKDEITGGEEDEKGKKSKSTIPTTIVGIERYWRYNALDTYNTLCCFVYCVGLMTATPWAIKNYSTEFALQMFYLEVGYRGFKTKKSRLNKIVKEKFTEASKELRRLKYWLSCPDFNMNSTAHKQDLFYSILGCKPPVIHGKETKSTDKIALGQIQYQHPLVKRFVDQLHKITVPNKLITDFANCELDNNRMLYSLNAAGTNTSRASSSNSPFWIGRNMQNIAPVIRESMVADEGMILFDIDYSQSDNYFVAYESEDEKCIEVVCDLRDTHCIHTAHFFKMSYEDAYNDPHKKAKDSPRSCTKKIVHGCNYDMQERTMFLNICAELGKDALYKAAELLGYRDAWTLSDKALMGVCKQLQESYFELYPHLKTWDKRLIKECYENGGTLTTAFGFTRKFFGNYVADKAIHRTMASLKGQGGTGGNINRAMYQFYYGRGDGRPSLHKRGARLLLQVHDSLVGEVPVDKMELMDELIDIMEQPVTIKNREMHVPVEADVGFTWSKSMLGYKKGDGNKNLANYVDFENKNFREKFNEPKLVI